MNYKGIDIGLAKRIIKHNPQLSDFDKDLLIDNGHMIKELIPDVLENTPDLTEEETQLIKQNGLRLSKRDGEKKRERFQGSEEVRANLVQKIMKTWESDPNYMRRQNSRPKIETEQNTAQDKNKNDN